MADRTRSKISVTPMNLLIAILVGTVIFFIVSAMRQEQEANLDSLSEAELVRLFDDVDSRITELTNERVTLQRELEELQSGADTRAAAAEAAAQQEMARKIQAGVVPVVGEGLEIRIVDAGGQLPGQSLVSLVQELRNAAAEAIEINDVRVVGRTSIVQREGVTYVNDTQITSPYTIRAIGDSNMMQVALEMPGGILATIRSRGPFTNLTQEESVEIHSVAELPTFTHAQPSN
ncbi:MAG: DUF881 domain-containing protein [Ruaniaceae bacterium]|nr:DUF881 domain-containing protein [Ruaniaceae bacterium]